MSLSLPPLALPSRYRRKSLSTSDGPPSPQMSLHASFYSCSPPLSSSPPRTPFSMSSPCSARIHSSPRSPFDTSFRIPDIDESLAFDSGSRYSPAKAPQSSITLPSFSASFPSEDELPYAFDYDASESSDEYSADDIRVSFQYRTNRKRPSYRIRTKRQRDEMEDPETDLLSDNSRGTFFSISAERGQWKNNPNNPMPLLPPVNLAPVAPLVFHTKGDSESSMAQTANAYVQDQHHAESSYPSPPISVPSDRAASDPSKESRSVLADELRARSKSPSPHSPIASRGSFLSREPSLDATSPVSPAHLHSPMSLPPSSPMTYSLSSAPVSPLSLTLDLPDNPDDVLTVIDQIAGDDVILENMDLESADDYLPAVTNDASHSLHAEVGIQTTLESDHMLTAIVSAPEVQIQPDCVKWPADELESAPSVTSLPTPCTLEVESGFLKLEPLSVGEIPTVEGPTNTVTESNMQESVPTPEISPEEAPQDLASPSPPPNDRSSTQLTILVPTEATVKTEVIHTSEASQGTAKSSPEADTEKKKYVKRRTKRREIEFLSSDNDSDASGRSSSSAKANRRKSPKLRRGKPLRKRSRVLRVVEDDEDEEQVRVLSCPKRSFVDKPLPVSATATGTKEKSDKRKARRRKADVNGGDKENKARRRISTASSRACASSAISDSDVDPTPRPTTPVETVTLCAEMRGMLIESMATSRASSLPLSTLCRSILQSRPALATQKSEKQWLKEFEGVLEEGWKGCGVFGKVESSWKDDSGSSLEARWFYVPERDEDQERATLIRSMMPRPGKRSETKKYKQYYYRPLEKISRWDPEDEM